MLHQRGMCKQMKMFWISFWFSAAAFNFISYNMKIYQCIAGTDIVICNRFQITFPSLYFISFISKVILRPDSWKWIIQDFLGFIYQGHECAHGASFTLWPLLAGWMHFYLISLFREKKFLARTVQTLVPFSSFEATTWRRIQCRIWSRKPGKKYSGRFMYIRRKIKMLNPAKRSV